MTTSTNTPSEQSAIPEGMVAWAGGDSAPSDWDGEAIYSRDGFTFHVALRQDDHRWKRIGLGSDIIAYTPKPAIPANAGGTEAAWRGIVRAAEDALGRYLADGIDRVSDDDSIGFKAGYRQAAEYLRALPVDQPAQASERYSLGLMTEEMGETLKIIGKALRFGMDTPGPDNPEYQGRTARQMLPAEVGDLHAAIRFGAMAGVFSMTAANAAEETKLAKLLDPASKDAQGNRLAPSLNHTQERAETGK